MAGEDDVETKRIHTEPAETNVAYVAGGAGLARVDLSGDVVGRFSLVSREPAVDVVALAGGVAVATPEDVLLGDVAGDDALEETGFGAATAVGAYGGLVAAGDGRVARYGDGSWTTLCDLDDVRAVDGDLVATGSGVHRLDGSHVGLADVRDVTTAVEPLAATADGLYALANGWTRRLEGAFDVVAGTAEAGGSATAHAAAGTGFYERSAGGGDGRGSDDPSDGWLAVDLPVDEAVVDVDYGTTAYAVTAGGTVLAAGDDGWRFRSLGLPDVRAVAVV